MNEENHHRIVRLEASNVKKLKAVDIVPNRDTIVLSGKNKQGKSSVLDSIFYTLAGKKAMPERPIRDGQSKAEVTIDMGEFVVSLKITAASGPRLTIKSKDGLDVRSPATLLANYTNEILLDPVKFLRLGETPEGKRRQAEILRGLVGLDFSGLEAAKAQAYQERTMANRKADEVRAKLGSYPALPNAPKEEVLVGSLITELQSIEEQHKAALRQFEENREASLKLAEDANRNRDQVGTALSKKKEAMAELEKEIQSTQERLTNMKATCAEGCRELLRDEQLFKELSYTNVAEIRAQFAQAREKLDSSLNAKTAPIKQKITDAGDLNTAWRQDKRRQELADELRAAEAKATALTTQITECDKSKESKLAECQFPLPGLSFDESGVLLNKLPLSQASQAEQLKAVLAIGFALKPKIRVALVRDASILDEQSLKEVESLCAEQDGQCWLEVVNSMDPTAIEIVDGEIRDKQ